MTEPRPMIPITDNVKYRLGERTLLIKIYDEDGSYKDCILFEIAFEGIHPIIVKATLPDSPETERN